MADAGNILVKVDQLLLSNMGFVVLLKGVQDERSLPIFIGGPEAQAIALQMQGVAMPRPLTHDLLKKLLDFLECRLMRIEVCGLKEGTFYANLILDRDGGETNLDCRPSDAIALALRCGVPILVGRTVMDEAGRVFDEAETRAGLTKEAREHPPAEPPRQLSPLEALTRELDKAVAEERYEDAARLRDQINALKSSDSGN
jgi:uncharacterized protein